MPAYGDLVHQTTSGTGTGNLTLAAVNGKRTFLTAFGTGGTNTFDYYISNREAAEWERGTGHEASGALVRDTVLASSNANALVNFSAGTKDCTNDQPANKRLDKTGDSMSGPLDITDSTGSSSTTTGALKVAGGVGIVGQLNVTSMIELINGSVLGFFQNTGSAIRFGTITGHALEILTSAAISVTLGPGGGMVVGSATGGNKGDGTINAIGVYDDNVLLTCFGTEFAMDGKIDLAKWDALSPQGRNPLAHQFAELVESFDPRDPAAYVARMKETRALPGMPSEADWQHGKLSVGEIHNRLWLAVELLAAAFANSYREQDKRLTALEERLNGD